jgi:outer membrane receptor protein involved in Fe transport
MKILLVVAALFSGVFTASAQFPGAAGRGSGTGSSGSVYGKVIDKTSGKPIGSVSIQFIQNKFDTVTRKRRDTVINGMLTLSNGDFRLENLPTLGNFKLKITAIGYILYEQKVSFEVKMGGDPSQMMSAFDKDLGNIKLETDVKQLANVTVTSDKGLVQLGIDRKVFNVEKNITSAGGTAVDVMRNVPSVSVDIDGNVSLRNNAPQIFVDGRPSPLTLDQIPADAIASVEIITNPSAKFDASGGTSGILNIVLKKNRKVGYNGSVRSGIDSRARVNLGGDINVRQNKVNVFLAANYNQRKSISNGNTDRNTFITSPSTQLTQLDENIAKGYFGMLRGGFDYFIDNRNSLTFTQTFSKGRFTPFTDSEIWVDTLFAGGKATSFNERISNTTAMFENKNSAIGFKHNFVKAGRELTADFNYSNSRNKNNNLVTTDFFNSFGGPVTRNIKQQLNGSGRNQNFTFQTDFVNPLNDKSKMELGLRIAMRKGQNGNDLYTVIPSGELIYLAPLSTLYKSNDQVYAAYGTYSAKIKQFGFQLGLRVESSRYEGELIDKGQQFSNEFPVSLFPSVFLTQKLKNDQDLQFNYTRRINRPNFFQLLPFTDYSDSLNLSRGNPDLIPEFTNSMELSYQKTFKNNNSLLASGYFKYTTGLITRFQISEKNPVNNQDRLINTFINSNSSYVTGLEITSRNTIAPWWDMTTNLNFFTSYINIDIAGQPAVPKFFSWFGKWNNNFKLPKNISIQLSAEYQSKTILPPGGSGGGSGFGGGGGRGGGMGGFGQSASTAQGFVRPNYGIDLAIRYEFLKEKKASLSLSMNDIFRTRRSDVFSESAFFTQNVFRRRDPQVLRLNFSWRFGKFDMSLFKRKNMRTGTETGDGGGMQ